MGRVCDSGKVSHDERWVIQKREIIGRVMSDSRESDPKGWS
jgi:hypothetical protein